jgi:hypothetical protein
VAAAHRVLVITALCTVARHAAIPPPPDSSRASAPGDPRARVEHRAPPFRLNQTGAHAAGCVRNGPFALTGAECMRCERPRTPLRASDRALIRHRARPTRSDQHPRRRPAGVIDARIFFLSTPAYIEGDRSRGGPGMPGAPAARRSVVLLADTKPCMRLC